MNEEEDRIGILKKENIITIVRDGGVYLSVTFAKERDDWNALMVEHTEVQGYHILGSLDQFQPSERDIRDLELFISALNTGLEKLKGIQASNTINKKDI